MEIFYIPSHRGQDVSTNPVILEEMSLEGFYPGCQPFLSRHFCVGWVSLFTSRPHFCFVRLVCFCSFRLILICLVFLFPSAVFTMQADWHSQHQRHFASPNLVCFDTERNSSRQGARLESNMFLKFIFLLTLALQWWGGTENRIVYAFHSRNGSIF